FAMRGELFVVLDSTAERMEAERERKKREEREREGVLIDPQHPTPAADWPRCLRITAVQPWVLVTFARPVEGSGLSRTLLPQFHRDQDERAHLQELALPILEQGFDEVPAREVAAQGDQ